MKAGHSRRASAGWLVLTIGVLVVGVLLVYWRLLLTNRVLAAGDAFTYFTPYRDYANAALREGRLPLWNPYLFLGVPFLANPQAGVLYPLNWPFVGMSASKSLVATLGLHLWLAGLGMAIYGRRVVRLDWLPALVAGLIFSLSGFLGAHAAQINQVSAAAWLPWMLWLLEEAWGSRRPGPRGQSIAPDQPRELWRRFNWLALAGLAVVVALQMLAGHTQSSFINMVGLTLAAGWPAIAALLAWGWRRLRRSPVPLATARLRMAAGRLFMATVATGLGLLLAAVQLLPTWELAGQSVRSEGLSFREAVSFSLQPRGLLLTLLPTYGENLADRFGTPAFGELVAYIGVSGLLLAGVAILAWAQSSPAGDSNLDSFTAFSLGLVIIGLALALGIYNPLTFLLYQLVPGFDLFRAPARWMILSTFGLAALAGLGAQVVYQGQSRALLSDWISKLRRRRRITFPMVALGVLVLIFVAVQKWPSVGTLLLWLAVGLVVTLVLWRAGGARVVGLLILLVMVELAAASLALDHTRATAPEAVTSLRTAPAQLLADAQEALAEGKLPGRFLSMSGITYDPGDLAEIEQMLAGQLSPPAIYDFVVATKLQEIVAPNLSLLWRLPAVDGYDGGVLPLQRYVDLQSLFLAEDTVPQDGRLREQLVAVPPARLLRLLGVEHVITDKGFDLWVDGVYYDLELSTRLEGDEAVTVARADRLESTDLGVFTHLEGASGLADGTPVAEIEVLGQDGSRQALRILAGVHTAEGAWQPSVGHSQPEQRAAWPREEAGWDYLARFGLEEPILPQRIVVRSLLTQGSLNLRGITLIDSRTGAHAALTMPADGDFQRVHSGDVKVYRNLQALPRAFLVGQAQVVATDATALDVMADPGWDPSETAVLLRSEVSSAGMLDALAGLSPEASAGTVRLERYEPEYVELLVDGKADGLLVLSDTWDEGWQASVDGVRVPILRTNGLFRSVLLGPGSHRVAFAYRPAALRTGAWISGITGLFVLALLAGGLLVRQHQRS